MKMALVGISWRIEFLFFTKNLYFILSCPQKNVRFSSDIFVCCNTGLFPTGTLKSNFCGFMTVTGILGCFLSSVLAHLIEKYVGKHLQKTRKLKSGCVRNYLRKNEEG